MPGTICYGDKDHLEFLDGFLGNGGADAVDGVVHGVGAVDADHVGAGARAADAQAAVGSRADGVGVVTQRLRIYEGEIDVVAAVDGKIFDLALLDGLRTFGAGDFDGGGFGGHGDGLSLRAQLERHVGGGLLADRQLHIGAFVRGEIRAGIDAHFVDAGDEADESVVAGIIHDDGALGTRGEKRDGDFCAADSETLRVNYVSGESSGVDLGHRGTDAQKNCHTENHKRKQRLPALHTEPPWIY